LQNTSSCLCFNARRKCILAELESVAAHKEGKAIIYPKHGVTAETLEEN
jgi:hypothetical protein